MNSVRVATVVLVLVVACCHGVFCFFCYSWLLLYNSAFVCTHLHSSYRRPLVRISLNHDIFLSFSQKYTENKNIVWNNTRLFSFSLFSIASFCLFSSCVCSGFFCSNLASNSQFAHIIHVLCVFFFLLLFSTFRCLAWNILVALCA